jgi:transposase-like protein
METLNYLENEETARAYLEEIRWPQGPVCPHCGASGAHRMPPRLYRCNSCRSQFSVTVGTIFQDSNTPPHKWLQAIHLICTQKMGITAAQLQRDLGFGSYRTASLLCHRIRWALQQKPMAALVKRTGEPASPSPRRPLMIRVPWDQSIQGLLAVTLETREIVKGDRKTGAKLERRPTRKAPSLR